MSEHALEILLEDLAASVVMTEADSKPAVAELMQKFEKFHAGLDASRPAILSEHAKEAIGLLVSIIMDDSKSPDADLQAVSALVVKLQHGLRGGAAPAAQAPAVAENDENSAQAPPDSDLLPMEDDPSEEAAPQPFHLPDWVEENTFRDFIASQPLVLEEIEGDLLAVEKNDSAGIAAFKRRIHTLKGEAGVLGLEDMEEVCHAMEDFVDLPLSPAERVDVLLQAKDWIASALLAYADLHQPATNASDVLKRLRPAPPSPEEKAVPARTPAPAKPAKKSATGKRTKAEKPAADSAPEAAPEAPAPRLAPAPEAEEQTQVKRDPETVTMIGDFITESSEGLHDADQLLMECEQEEADLEKVNGLFRVFHTIKGVAGFLELRDITELAHVTETMLNQSRQGHLALRGHALDLCFDSTELMRAMLKSVQGAVEQNLSIPKEERLPSLLRGLNDVIAGRISPSDDEPPADPPGKLGEVLVRRGRLDEEALSAALNRQQETGMRLGEQLIADGKISPKDVGQALRVQKTQATTAKIKETIKIDVDRVDSLVEMIGELVIVESMVVNAPEISALASLQVRNYLNQLTKITRDLQSAGMRMRMVPVRGVFQKMARMVRDLSRKGGKLVGFRALGEGTEMDRSMVEQIADPLVHMIRNSVDHGIETTEERRRTGKPEEGIIQLSAYHEGGSIVIEISDDGRGLDREKILAKAIRQGLVKPDEIPADPDLFALIFQPGFSTAQKVTEISGRGVGMDVVKRNIESMRGRVLIDSTPGKGTVFKMVLPLTLAIIDGMLIRCGKENYIIPTLSIVESIKPDRSMLSAFADSCELINVRDEILPLIRLDRVFDIEGAVQDPTEGLVVLVESFGRKIGVLVDDVISQQQVVIKKVSDDLQRVKFVAGAAIMSNGRVGLILNVDELSRLTLSSGNVALAV